MKLGLQDPKKFPGGWCSDSINCEVNKKVGGGVLKIADSGIAFRGSEPNIIWCKRKRMKYKRGAEGQVH